MSTTIEKNHNTGQLVSFYLDKEELAMPIMDVQEIIRYPEVKQVPRSPDYIRGIGNLRGQILPIIDLRKRLGMEVVERNDQTRIVVLRHKKKITGLVVDRISEVLQVEDNIFEKPPEIISGIEGKYLTSVAKVDEGKRLIMQLDLNAIIPEQNPNAKGDIQDNQTVDDTQSDKNKVVVVEKEEHLVTFNFGGEEFAIDIMEVQEIIRVNEINKAPDAPEFVLGLMSLRNRLLPVINMRTLFGTTGTQIEEVKVPQNDTDVDMRRIVVVDLKGVITGILVDSVSEVLQIPESKLELPPPIISSKKAKYLKNVGKCNDGKRLIMILDMKSILNAKDAETLSQISGASTDTPEKNTVVLEEETQLVVFRIGGEEYAVDIMKAQEIIRFQKIISVPRAPAFVEGILNLRGIVLPIIDMRKRFNLENIKKDDSTRIIVVDIEGKKTGLIVDSVSEVLCMRAGMIEVPPELFGGIESRYIESVGKIDHGERMIIIINLIALFSDEELSELQSMKKNSEEDRNTEKKR